MRTLIASLAAAFVLITTVIAPASAADVRWATNPGWFPNMLMSGSGPVKFFGSEARKVACAVAPTLKVGSKSYSCNDSVDVKVAACGTGGAKLKIDNKGKNWVLCTSKSFPVVIKGVTFVDATGSRVLN